MSSLAWQRSQSNAKKRKQEDGPELSTMSFRDKLRRRLRKLELPRPHRMRIAALILDDPVAAHKEIKAWERYDRRG